MGLGIGRYLLLLLFLLGGLLFCASLWQPELEVHPCQWAVRVPLQAPLLDVRLHLGPPLYHLFCLLLQLLLARHILSPYVDIVYRSLGGATVAGTIRDLDGNAISDFDGEAQIVVLDSDIHRSLRPGTPGSYYHLPGARIFSGEGQPGGPAAAVTPQ